MNEAVQGAIARNYWTANTLDAEAHLLTFTHGESATYTDSGYSGPTVTAVNTSQNLNAANGRITAITAGAGNGIQDFAYTYDKNGNLTIRQDNVTSVTETFGYDGLNRLVTSQVGTNAAKSYTYDAVGNLTGRSDWGSYTYPNYGPSSVRPHAVSSIAITQGAEAGHTVAFAYDANGNLTGKTQTDAGSAVIAARSRSTVWNSFNMPNCIVAANGITSCAGNTAPNTQFWYGPEHQRIKQTSSQDGTTWYLNPDNAGGLSYEKDQKPDASIEQRHFLSAYGQVVAIVKCASTCTSRTLNFLHRDNLGSTTAITDATGTVIERLAYEPFGKRRLTNGNDDSSDSLTTGNTTPNSGHTTSRGFTNHEMLDELGLVHMNGRIYDPQVGRFMSADYLIQNPYDMQVYNRYSYVRNNPLIYTDPTGQWFFEAVAIIAGARALGVINTKTARSLVAVAAAFATGQYVGQSLAASTTAGSASGTSWAVSATQTVTTTLSTGQVVTSAAYTLTPAGSAVVGASAGFSGTYVASGGDFRTAVKGAAGGAIFGAVDGYYGDHWSTARLGANALAGGVSSKMYGGNFISGFTNSFITGTAKWAYVSQVGYDTNPLPGENRPNATGDATYAFDENGRQLQDSIRSNVVGLNSLVGSCKQQSTCSKLFNLIPGINATGGLHDYWFNRPGASEQTGLMNWGTMLPAAAITYPALLNGPLSVGKF